jgi:DNA-binding LytR/AlgR family response regulator
MTSTRSISPSISTPLRCVIIEDEPLALERLTEYVRRLPFLELRASFDNAVDALAFLQETAIELLFLDISLGGMSGIDLLETAAVSSRVILVTAHQDYAVRAYELDVTDYLLKPFTFQRFVQAVTRVRTAFNESRDAPPRTSIFVKTELRLERVELRDILYIEGAGDYRRIHTVSKRILTLQTFAELERTIAAQVVCRVHKSFMVALDKIESVERDRVRIGEVLIPVSDSYRERFYTLIGQR